MMENLVTIIVVALLVVFHRPLAALAGGVFALLAMAVLLFVMFICKRDADHLLPFLS